MGHHLNEACLNPCAGPTSQQELAGSCAKTIDYAGDRPNIAI